MKKVFFLHFFILSGSLIGQNIPNPGFENWTTSGDYEIPVGWEASYLGDTGTIYKTPDSHSGQYAVALIMTGDSTPGISWCSRTILAAGAFFNPAFSYSGRPAALSGYYKFFPINGDTMSISFGLMQSGSLMGNGEFFSTVSTGNSYQYFEIPVNYSLSGNSDMAGISASVDGGSALCNFIGSILILDDLAFVDSTVGSEKILMAKNNIQPNPNPFTDLLHIDYSVIEACSINISVYNVTGQKISELISINQHQAGNYTTTFDARKFSAGVYFIRILANEKSETLKVVKMK